MRTIGNAAWTCVVACILLNGCRDAKQETKRETSTQSASKGASDEVRLTAEAQAEQKIEVASVESGVAVVAQRAKGRIALPDNATWRVGVLAEGRVENVYFNLGDSVMKGQVLARMHSHDMHEARAAYANAVAERSRLRAAEGRTSGIEDIGNIILLSSRGVPVLLRDVAQVGIGPAPKLGAVLRNGETISGMVIMLKGENGKRVIDLVKEKIKSMRLPAGVKIVPFYDQSTVIDGTIHTVKKNLFEGFILVTGSVLVPRKCTRRAEYRLDHSSGDAHQFYHYAPFLVQCEPDEPRRNRLWNDRRWCGSHDGELDSPPGGAQRRRVGACCCSVGSA
jgi:hypothetical protein